MTHDCMTLGKRAFRRVAAFGALAGALLSAAAPAAAQEMLTYVTYFNSNDPLVQVDSWFMKEVEKRTGGAVKFETYLGGAMLGGPEIYPGLSRGAADIGMSVPAAFQPTDFVLTNVTLPYTADDSVAVTYAFNELYAKSDALQAEYGKQNVKLLYALGFSENTIWSNAPINTVEDLKGMRIRSVMAVADALSLLGAVPVSMGFADAVAGLQRQAIDGFSSAPFVTSIATGLQEVAPYVSDGGGMGVYAVSSTSINLDKWNGLSPEAQKVIAEVAAEAPGYYASILNQMVDQGVESLHEKGVTKVILMSDKEKARVREAVAQPLWQKWIAAANNVGVDGQAFLDQYRALVAEKATDKGYVPGLVRYSQKYGQ